MTFAGFVHGVVGGEINDFEEMAAGDFATSAGGEIIGIAGDPGWQEAVKEGMWKEQSDGACGIMMAPVVGFNAVADMAGVEDDIVILSETEGDIAQGNALIMMDHAEAISGDKSFSKVRTVEGVEDKFQFLINQYSWIKKPGYEHK